VAAPSTASVPPCMLHRRHECGAGADRLTGRAMTAKAANTHGDARARSKVARARLMPGELTVIVRASCRRMRPDWSERVAPRSGRRRAGVRRARRSGWGVGSARSASALKNRRACLGAVLPQGETAFDMRARPRSPSPTAHAANVNVWGLHPRSRRASASASGRHQMSPAATRRRVLSITDHDGAQVAAAKLRDVWPGTSALYFAR
jgi:hypothetical protein